MRGRERDDAMLAAICAATPDAVFIKGLDGTYLFANETCARLLGCPASEIIGATDDAWFGPVIGARVRARDAEIVASGSSSTYEEELPTPSGVRVYSTMKAPYRDADGVLRGVLGISRDITEQQRERELLRSVLATVPDHVLRVDRYRRIQFVNRVWAGYTVDQLVGTQVEEWVHPDQREYTRSVYDRVLETGEPASYESRAAAPDGSYRWVSVRIAAVRVAGVIVGATMSGSDITEHKRRDDELRASRASLSSVVTTTPDLLMSLDRELRITFINRAHVSDVVGMPFADVVTAETSAGAVEAIQRVLETGALGEYEAQMIDRLGGKWKHTHVGPIVQEGAIVGVTLSASDMTSQLRAARALRQSQERYQRLIEVLPDAVFVHIGGKITYANQAFLRMRGITELADIVGKSPFDIFHADDHAGMRERMAALRASPTQLGPIACRCVGVDGVVRPVSVVATVLREEEQFAVVAVLHDLSALERSDLMLRSVLESASDAIVTLDASGTLLAVNTASRNLFGYAPEELIGRGVGMLLPPSVAGAHSVFLENTGTGGREVIAQRQDGTTFPCDLMVTSFLLHGRQHFTGVMRDITERKRLEDQFRQAHKMEAFGQLAGGVAHDFNNLLTVILGATEMIALSLRAPEMPITEINTSVGDIQNAAERAAELTRQLLAFSRRTLLEPRVIDVNESIRETQKILRRLIGEDITLVVDLAQTLPRVFVDPGQLSQVLMNLCLNARDAMPQGGRLELTTSIVTLDAGQAATHSLPRGGRYVRLAVRDTGTGMSEDVRAQVFQPFFTTKGLGRGTGLGLAVVHGVVTQSGGAVAVTSQLGTGSTFEILLPAAQAEAAAVRARAPLATLRGSETVLVVEDDDAVRRLAVRSLRSRGHRVVVAEDGEAALRVLEEQAASIDIAVIDVVMPRLDGRRLAEIIEAKYPGIAVLFVSGYTDDMLETRGLDAAQLNFLHKPYTAGTLTQAVRRVLEHRAPPERASRTPEPAHHRE